MTSSLRRVPAGLLLTLLLAATPMLVRAETLERAVMRGIARNPDIQVAQSLVSQATIELEMAGNGRLPTFSASSGPAAAGLGYDVTLTQPL